MSTPKPLIVEALLDGNIEYLGQKAKIHSFLGGSRRFDYHNQGSDWDIFVYPEEPIDLEILQSRLITEWLVSQSESTYYQIEGVAELWVRSSQPRIHVVIFEHGPQGRKAFQELADEHFRLEEFMREHKVIITMAYQMKRGQTAGACIYQCLVDLMKSMQGRRESNVWKSS